MDYTPWEVISRSIADTMLVPSSMAVAARGRIEGRIMNSCCFDEAKGDEGGTEEEVEKGIQGKRWEVSCLTAGGGLTGRASTE